MLGIAGRLSSKSICVGTLVDVVLPSQAHGNESHMHVHAVHHTCSDELSWVHDVIVCRSLGLGRQLAEDTSAAD